MRMPLGLAVTVALTTPLPAQAPRAASVPAPVLIKAGRLIDGRSDAAQSNVGIVVEGERIKAVGPLALVQGQARTARVIDLSQFTVLPGFIDTHTHLLLQGDPTAESYDQQLLYQSIAYRAILGARNARLALEHGFTALRDLETEGAMYADVDIKRAITNGEIPGPRIFASTRAMAPTGMYPIVSTNWELELPHGVEPVDGVDGARRAVREQVAHGADWIKYYSDRRYYFTPDSVLHSWVNFTDDEAKAIVNEAHRLGRKVAAHAIGSDGIAAALRAGVNTIEHGDGMTDSLADLLAARGVYWVPTVTVSRYVAGPRGGPWGPMVEHQRQAMARALKKGVKIVLGTDVGGFPWTELNQAKEFEYYVQYGMSPLQAIKSGTSLAAELLSQPDLGAVAPGRRELGFPRLSLPRHGRPSRLPFAEPRRRGSEPHRPRARPRAGGHPDGRVVGRAPGGRRPPVLHARVRLRVLEDRRGDAAVLAARLPPRRRARGDPPLPAADHPLDLLRDGARRARP